MKHWIQNNRGFLIFLLCLGFLRTAVADWNPIPSGSMRPNLLEGDVVLVNRLAYDVKLPLTDVLLAHLADPRRGDIVTFSSPQDGTRLIKRIVALPGDRVEMRQDVLFINGEAARYDDAAIAIEPEARTAVRLTEHVAGQARRIQLLPQAPAQRDFAEVTVPAAHYLVLGDNRDNSADSRYIGFVPRHLLIGRAHHLLASVDIEGDWRPRLDRFGQGLR